MMIKVKICGVKTLDTALTALSFGADYLGFNFVHTSKNYIKPEKAKEIIDALRHSGKRSASRIDSGVAVLPRMTIVGVFQDERLEKVQAITENLGLDLVQLHGFEDNDYCQKVGKPVIKVFMVPSEFNEEDLKKEMSQFQVDFYMLDREKRGVGDRLNPLKVKELASEFHIFLAGGLTSENISQVLKVVKPFAIDISSGVETEGVKDNEKIKKFIEIVKRMDPALRRDDEVKI